MASNFAATIRPPSAEDALKIHQARAAIERLALAPSHELSGDGSRYTWVWWTGTCEPHGKWLPADWFARLGEPPNSATAAWAISAAIWAFGHLPADRRRELAGF